MAERVRVDIQICQLIPLQNGLNKTNLRAIGRDPQVRKSRLTEDVIIRVITALFVQAIGIENFKRFASSETFPFTAHTKFFPTFKQDASSITMVVNTIMQRKSPLESDEVKESYQSQGFGTIVPTKTTIKYWLERAVRVMPHPLFTARQEGYHPDVVAVAETYHHEIQELPLFLYSQLAPGARRVTYSAFPLLNLYKCVALMTPAGPMTWGCLVETYRDCVPDESLRAEDLLRAYPFPCVAQELHTLCPIPCEHMDRYEPFQDFTIRMTLKSMAFFLCHTLPRLFLDNFSRLFSANESFRHDFALFMRNPKQRFVDAEGNSFKSLGGDPVYSEEETRYFVAYRMYYQLVHYHIPVPKRETEEGAAIFEWAFHSNHFEVLNIDQDYYLGATPPNYSDPQRDVPMVGALQNLYEKNGETFIEQAFSLLMLIISLKDPETFIDFLLRCHVFPHAAISTSQVFQYSHFNDAQVFENDIHFLEGLHKLAPVQLRGTTPAFFHLFHTPFTTEVDERHHEIAVFNNGLRIRPDELINADLYYKALRCFLMGRITVHHLEVFDLYKDEFPHMSVNEKLDLMLRATVRDGIAKRVFLEDSGELDLARSDPPALFKTLKLIDKSKEPGIARAVPLFEQTILKRRRVSIDAIKSLRRHFLSPLPETTSEKHLAYIVDRIDYLGHPFTEAQLLRIFYEFLSLEANHEQIHCNVEFIKIIELMTCSNERMNARVVTQFLVYHPKLSMEQAGQLRSQMDRFVECRTKFLKSKMVERPVLPRSLVRDFIDVATQLQLILHDPEREMDFIKEGAMVQYFIAPFQSYICYASIPISIRFLTAALPSIVPQRGPRNQALMPLDYHQDVGKQFYASWEQTATGFLMRFSLVTSDEKRCFSGKAPLNIEEGVIPTNPSLLLIVKHIVYHLGFDGAVRGDYPDLNTLEGFLAHPKVAPVWDPFIPSQGDKGEIGEALFLFCTTLRVSLRKTFLYLATMSNPALGARTSQRMDPLFISTIAAEGHVIPNGTHHLLPPYEFVKGSRHDLMCYGTFKETLFLMDREQTRVDNALKRYEVTFRHETLLHISIHDTLALLPLEVHGAETVIDYDDREYKELDSERDAYKCDAYALILSTEVDRLPLSVRVVYTGYDLYTKDTFTKALSWHIAQLKARVYERIVSAQ
ncbi:MAG: hypothetical protein KFB93_03030 [Simkaniaceae bacterium]|nr:MAG: hypothetical protein KFB93_03030 [Simkaniaceae bacterium]